MRVELEYDQIRMHEIIDGVEGDIQWKENQLLGTGSRGQFCARIVIFFAICSSEFSFRFAPLPEC